MKGPTRPARQQACRLPHWLCIAADPRRASSLLRLVAHLCRGTTREFTSSSPGHPLILYMLCTLLRFIEDGQVLFLAGSVCRMRVMDFRWVTERWPIGELGRSIAVTEADEL